MDYYKSQEHKVAWGKAVQLYVSSPVHKKLEELMGVEVEKLQKKLRKGTGDPVEDDKIRAKLDVWEKWDKEIQGWLKAKEKAASVLAGKEKEG